MSSSSSFLVSQLTLGGHCSACRALTEQRAPCCRAEVLLCCCLCCVSLTLLCFPARAGFPWLFPFLPGAGRPAAGGRCRQGRLRQPHPGHRPGPVPARPRQHLRQLWRGWAWGESLWGWVFCRPRNRFLLGMVIPYRWERESFQVGLDFSWEGLLAKREILQEIQPAWTGCKELP